MFAINSQYSKREAFTPATAPKEKPKIDQTMYMTPLKRDTELSHLINTCIKVNDLIPIVLSFFENEELDHLYEKSFPYEKTIGLGRSDYSYDLMNLFLNSSLRLFAISTNSSDKMALCYAGEAVTHSTSLGGEAVQRLLLGANSKAEILLEQIQSPTSRPENKLFAFSSTPQLSNSLVGSLTVLGSFDFKIRSRTPFQVFEINVTEKGLTPGAALKDNIPTKKDKSPKSALPRVSSLTIEHTELKSKRNNLNFEFIL